jgi:hydroxyethylthiazole kinase
LIVCFVAVDIVASSLLSIGCECLLIEEPLSHDIYNNLDIALHVNIGTMTQSTHKAAITTITTARSAEAQVRWVLDPVAATLTKWRTEAVFELLALQPAVITVNVAEVKMLAISDPFCEEFIEGRQDCVSALNAARSMARKYQCVIMCVDIDVAIVTDGITSLNVREGSQLAIALRTIASGRTMLSAVCAAFIAACPEDELIACVHALAFVTVAFQSVMKRANSPRWGPKLRNYMLDEMFSLTRLTSLARPKIRDVHWTIMDAATTPIGDAQ